MDITNLGVTTTSGENFSGPEHAQLAYLIWHRFGRDAEVATAAWCRLLQNNCPVHDFMELVRYHCGLPGAIGTH